MLCMILASSHSAVDAQDSVDGVGTKTSTPSFEVERETVLSHGPGGYLMINADLGSLPMKANGKIKLLVKNSTGEDIELGTYYSGCSCLQVVLSTTQVAADEFFAIDMNLETKQSTKEADQWVAVSLAKDKSMKGEVALRLKYRIDGLVAFRDALGVIPKRSGDTILKFQIPLIIEKPARASDLIFSPSGGLEKMQYVLTEVEGRPSLSCSIATDNIPDVGLAGELHLQDKSTGIKDTMLLRIENKSEVTIAPQPLRFKESDGEFKASAIVRILSRREQAEQSEESRISVKGNISDGKIAIHVENITDGVARLNFEVSPSIPIEEFRNQESEGVFLSFVYEGVKHTTKIPFVFSN